MSLSDIKLLTVMSSANFTMLELWLSCSMELDIKLKNKIKIPECIRDKRTYLEPGLYHAEHIGPNRKIKISFDDVCMVSARPLHNVCMHPKV